MLLLIVCVILAFCNIYFCNAQSSHASASEQAKKDLHFHHFQKDAVFHQNNLQHNLPTVAITSDYKIEKKNNSHWKIKGPIKGTHLRSIERDVKLFTIQVTATFPFYTYYQMDLSNQVQNPGSQNLREAKHIFDETTFRFQFNSGIYLSYVKWKNTSVDFRSSERPFFGISVSLSYDAEEDAVTISSCSAISKHVYNYLNWTLEGKKNACNGHMFFDQILQSNSNISLRKYGCKFLDGADGAIDLLYPVGLNIIHTNDFMFRTSQSCWTACQLSSDCKTSPQDISFWLPSHQHQSTTNYASCRTRNSSDSSHKKFYSSPLILSLPQGANRTSKMYSHLEDVEPETMIEMQNFPKTQILNTILLINCTVAEYYASHSIQFAFQYEEAHGSKDLEFISCNSISKDKNAYSRSMSCKVLLSNVSIHRIYCFAPVIGSYSWINASRDVDVSVGTVDSTNQSRGIAVPIISIPILLVILILTSVVICLAIKLRRRSTFLTVQERQDFLNGNSSSIIKQNNSDSEYHSAIYKEAFDPKFSIPRNSIKFETNDVIGSGQYGIVMKGGLTIGTGEPRRIPIAIKTVKQNVDVSYFKALLSEVKIMAYLEKSPNVVEFIGACVENIAKGEIYVAVEFCENGDLLKTLRNLKSSQSTSVSFTQEDTSYVTIRNFSLRSSAPRLSDSEEIKLLEWSRDIANGMAFIASKNVIHGDLAARNVLLTINNVAKISDFGLSRQLLSDYSTYVKKSSVPLPWKWMAWESITSSMFSVKSDVWSFGVTLWEIFSLGDLPHPGLQYNEAFVGLISNGHRLSKPDFATDEIYNIMQRCWERDPHCRPDISTVCAQFQELIRKMKISGGVRN